jgi:DNA-binding NarL/FixJ family response regulator
VSIRVLLVDDHQMMREGLRALLSRHGEIEVVGEADDGRQAVELARRLQPQVVVMDIAMGELNGVDATRLIRERDPAIGVVALSTHADSRFVRAMFEAGAAGYVVKSAAGDELLRAIRSVAGGQKYVSPLISSGVIDGYLGRAPAAPPAATLGARERQVLQLVAEGKSSPEIAAVLHLSPATVEAHRRNLMKKLDLHSVAELTKYAVREGLTSLDP